MSDAALRLCNFWNFTNQKIPKKTQKNAIVQTICAFQITFKQQVLSDLFEPLILTSSLFIALISSEIISAISCSSPGSNVVANEIGCGNMVPPLRLGSASNAP